MLKGELVFETDPPSTLVISSDIEKWQKLIDELKSHSDFASEPFFYYVMGVKALSNGKLIYPSNGIYKISADNSYEVKIVQYSPASAYDKEKVNWLLAGTDVQAISFITNKQLAVDSDYDEKILRFRTKDTTLKNDSMISIYRHANSEKRIDIQESIWDFDLNFEITAKKWKPIFHGILIGVFVASQGIIPLADGYNLNSKIIAMLFTGIAAGLLASFRLRKV